MAHDELAVWDTRTAVGTFTLPANSPNRRWLRIGIEEDPDMLFCMPDAVMEEPLPAGGEHSTPCKKAGAEEK
jgi:hypothetical protein